MCRTIKILVSNWPRTRKFSQLLQAGRTVAFDLFAHHGQALFTLYVQFLCSDWSKFDRWVDAENLCSILNLVTLTAEADRVLCQLVMFLTVFFYWMYKMKFTCYQEVLCYSWLVCLLGFWLRNMSLVKVGNTISDGIVFSFHLAWSVRGLKSLKRFRPYFIVFSASRMVITVD